MICSPYYFLQASLLQYYSDCKVTAVLLLSHYLLKIIITRYVRLRFLSNRLQWTLSTDNAPNSDTSAVSITS